MLESSATARAVIGGSQATTLPGSKQIWQTNSVATASHDLPTSQSIKVLIKLVGGLGEGERRNDEKLSGGARRSATQLLFY